MRDESPGGVGRDRLLAVDDDPEPLKLLHRALVTPDSLPQGRDGREALRQLRQNTSIWWSWTDLPDLTALKCCAYAQHRPKTPVLILTARDQLEERVAALDAGADDYLTKPFELFELQARVRAQLRRRNYEQSNALQIVSAPVTCGSTVEPQRATGRRVLNLSQREFELLCFLVRQPDTVHRREDILDGVWCPLSATRTPWTSTSATCGKRWSARRPPAAAHRARGGRRRGWRPEAPNHSCRSAPPAPNGDAQFAIHQGNQLLHQGQAKTTPRVPVAVDPLKPLDHPVAFLFGVPGPWS